MNVPILPRKTPLITLAALFGAAFNAQAVNIAAWDLDGNTSSLTMPATYEDSLITASDLSITGLSSANWPNTISVVQNNGSIDSLATALAAENYFTFSVSVDAGNEISFDDIDIIYSLGANTTPATTTFALLSSVTGFTDADTIASFSHEQTTSNTQGLSDTFDISGISELQGVTGTVEFRIAFFNTGENAMTRVAIGRGFNVDGANDIQINGSITAVPEPSYFACGALVLIGVCLMRRRR
ncbi:hypothetical protein [Cerasicoccus maritimus]|uniref:hypothetical protein n=1 Tax=Cerasicoccus maritimus TaxID=490089 RepID=UPI0028528DBF|nr:hypothetical protein [Cerasicoccus maritimus]